MPTYIGFNTINQFGKFTLLDFELIKRDLSNAFNIQQGELPGRPDYGTVIWSFIFENQTPETEQAIRNEIQRVAGGDPRIVVNSINFYPQQNGILLEVELQLAATQAAEILAIFFDQETRRASFI